MKQINPRILVKSINKAFGETADLSESFIQASEENEGVKLRIGNKEVLIQTFGAKISTVPHKKPWTSAYTGDKMESIGQKDLHSMLVQHENKYPLTKLAAPTQNTDFDDDIDVEDEIDDF